MDALIGLPVGLFADEELFHSRVRLRLPWPIDGGHSLLKGECFNVVGVQRRGPPNFRRRWILCSNARAKGIPIEADCLELIFQWPQSAERKDGR